MDFLGSSGAFQNASAIAYTASAIVAALVGGYYYYKNKFEHFHRMGLKNPRPVPVFGNFIGMLTCNRMETEKRWVRECGKLYGIFQASEPRFVVAHPELLRRICIKDFDVFPNHDLNDFLNDYQRRFIIFMQDGEWKRMRAFQTPTFTSGKIKRMYKLIDRCGDDLLQCFSEQFEDKARDVARGAVLNVREIYSLFTMDAIASCGFGLKLERARGSASIKSSRDDFVSLAMRLFEFNPIRFFIFLSLPKKLLLWFNMRVTPEGRTEPLLERVRHILATRRRQMADNKKFDDYLQLLIDAKLDDKMELNEMDTKENHHAGLTHESLLSDQQQMVSDVTKSNCNGGSGGATNNMAPSKLSLSDEDILCSGLFLLMVGLETTASLLTNCTYALAFHPDIQERLREEVEKMAELDDSKTNYVFDYEALTSCQYLDAVISETLRVLSPVLALDRVCKADYHVEEYNVTFPKGARIHLAYYAIMNDPDFWPEPEKFRPERFMPGEREKIVPGSYCPFGLGPRHCLGMRFSLTEAKLALAKVIMRFKFEPAPGTSYPPPITLGMGVCHLAKPLVTFKLRNS